jgi:F-type H+-transporting ATPase subunit alpha
MQEILKQEQYQPMSLEHQVMVFYAGTNGFADAVPLERMKKWEADMVRYLSTSHPEIGKDILEKQQITAENEKKLREALDAFRTSWQ